MKLARHVRLNRYYLSSTSLLVVSRRGGRGSEPVKKVNIIFNNKQINNKKHSKMSTYFMLKHLQRSILQNNRFTYELSPRISMLSLPHCFVNSENKTKKKKEISVTSLRSKPSSLVNSENKSKRKRNVFFLWVTYEILTFEVTRCWSLTTTRKAVKT